MSPWIWRYRNAPLTLSVTIVYIYMRGSPFPSKLREQFLFLQVIIIKTGEADRESVPTNVTLIVGLSRWPERGRAAGQRMFFGLSALNRVNNVWRVCPKQGLNLNRV